MSRLIRAGVEAKLAELLPKVVDIVEDPKTKPMRCLRLMEFLRDVALASLALRSPKPLDRAPRKPVSRGAVLPSLRIRYPDAALRRYMPKLTSAGMSLPQSLAARGHGTTNPPLRPTTFRRRT